MKHINQFINEAFRLRDDTKLRDVSDVTVDELIKKFLIMGDFKDVTMDYGYSDLYCFCEQVFGVKYGKNEKDKLIKISDDIVCSCKKIYAKMSMGDMTFYKQHVDPFLQELDKKRIHLNVLYQHPDKNITIETYNTEHYILLISGGRNGMAIEIIVGVK